MLSPAFQERFKRDVEASRNQRAQVRRLVQDGKWREAERDRGRFGAFAARTATRATPAGAEALQGPTVDLQDVVFLTGGSDARRAVGYVEVNDVRGSEVGTGFLVSPRLFLTCCHVIPDETAARGTQVVFDRESDRWRRPRTTTSFMLNPDIFALFSGEDQLDYALLAIGERNSGPAALDELGYCVLSDTPDRHVIGMNVNIIQHPRGWQKMIAVRNNLLTHRTDESLLYETDTEEGSSGSPVFNDDWDLIALHHWGSPFMATRESDGAPIPINVNEGVRISAIYKDLQSKLSQLRPQWRTLLEEVLALNTRTAAPPGGLVLSPPRPAPRQEAMELPAPKGATMEDSPANEIRLTIPIEVTIRVGVGTNQPVPVEAAAPAKALTRGAEALKLDRDYTNRAGYDSAFIPGHDIPMPSLQPALAEQLAPLRVELPDFASGELKYEHFSVKLNKAKRIAIFTATNIDGATYLNVDRDTGLVGGSEGETWYKDPRISASFFLDQSFYSAWSTYFDRGHLTRRTDPTWGGPDVAERANADTFHFTNCSPQHWRFNQTTKYWQGVERYILENGVIQADTGKHLCVFQGPIFDDQIDLWADDVQIPSSFFKIVLWQGASGLKAVGLVVDQVSLLSEPRRSLGMPHAVAHVDVSQWRVSIKKIQGRAGLKFSSAILAADTISQAGQPAVGAEAARLIRSFDDLLPRRELAEAARG